MRTDKAQDLQFDSPLDSRRGQSVGLGTPLITPPGSVRNPIPLRTRLTGLFPTFVVASLFAGFTAMFLRIAWNPSTDSYVQYVPIGAVFAAFLWDRLLPSWSGNGRPALCDVVVVALALMRVFIPPLPFVSGHALFAMYAALTARRLPLRAIALAVLAEVVYTKVFASGGWRSMLRGLAVAGIVAAIRRPVSRKSLSKSEFGVD